MTARTVNLLSKRWPSAREKNCLDCYNYKVHEHPQRLSHIPNAPTVFVCAYADISFASRSYLGLIVETIRRHSRKRLGKIPRRPCQTYYLQSKRPECFEPFVHLLPPDVVLLTTLETNRDTGYREFSKAPLPSERYRQFLALEYLRKGRALFNLTPGSELTFRMLSEWYLSLNELKALKSFDRIGFILANFNAVHGELFVNDLHLDHLNDYQKKRLDDKRAPRTVDYEISVVKTMVSWAYYQGKIDGKPVLGV